MMIYKEVTLMEIDGACLNATEYSCEKLDSEVAIEWSNSNCPDCRVDIEISRSDAVELISHLKRVFKLNDYHDELCDMVESLINDNKSIVIAPAVALLEKARGDANV